ncbi:MAG: COX15/CtaA family protein [candidate division Zixibacteria bacterium]|jgi:cytochrome c oxidase assembly protein subunit 15|nr:COX15/CtaA family protein [candidate division Zixibacteria bacterium]
MKSFRYSALLSLVATYMLIFIGGLVRVSGAGLGCPDWPKCFGRWIPPTSLSQLPPEIDPSQFNITLAWIEYGNRLVGVTVGLLIVLTAVLAIRYYRSQPRILWPSLATAFLVALQGWLGGVVVTSELHPYLVSAHLILAIATALLLLHVLLQSYYVESEAMVSELTYPVSARNWIVGLGMMTLFQVILGTQVRGRLEDISAAYPLASDLEWLSRVGAGMDAHLIVGVLTALFAFFVAYGLIRLSDKSAVLVKQAVWLMVALVALQLVGGIVFISFGLPAIVQLFHLWLATIFLGVLLVLYSVVSHARELPARFQKSVGKVIVAGLVLAAILTASGFAVIKEAELSRNALPVLGKLPEFTLTQEDSRNYSLIDMKGQVSLLMFESATSPNSVGMKVAFRDVYDRYAHSERLALVTVLKQVDTSPVSLPAYIDSLALTDNRWLVVTGPKDTTEVLYREVFRLADRDDIAGTNSFVLIDRMGRIRGFYRYDSDSDRIRLDRDIVALARIAR